MAGDAAQPCGYVILAFEFGQVPVQIEEDVLRYFFGSAALAQDAIGDGVDAALMPLQRLCELLIGSLQWSASLSRF
jgi:hypothetical protein